MFSQHVILASLTRAKVFMMVNGALGNMIQTMKCPEVWKPSLYMFLSIALSYSTHEGHFYWYTDPKAGPAFPKVIVFTKQI